MKYHSRFSPATPKLWITVHTNIGLRQNWHGTGHTRTYSLEQKPHQGRCMHEIPWWNEATILRKWCIWNRTGSRTTTGQRWHEFSLKWNTRQHHPETSCICQKELVQCGKKIQQHRKSCIENTTQTWGVSSLLFYQGGKCQNTPQGSCSHLQEGFSITVADFSTPLRIYQYKIWILYKTGPDLS